MERVKQVATKIRFGYDRKTPDKVRVKLPRSSSRQYRGKSSASSSAGHFFNIQFLSTDCTQSVRNIRTSSWVPIVQKRVVGTQTH